MYSISSERFSDVESKLFVRRTGGLWLLRICFGSYSFSILVDRESSEGVCASAEFCCSMDVQSFVLRVEDRVSPVAVGTIPSKCRRFLEFCLGSSSPSVAKVRVNEISDANG